MQTIEGRKKTQATIIKKYGLTADGKSQHHVTIGKIGGMVRNPEKGFGGDRERARLAGIKGGHNGKRTWTDEQRIAHSIKMKRTLAKKDFQKGFNEPTPSLYQRMIGKR